MNNQFEKHHFPMQNLIAKQTIVLLQEYIQSLGFKAVIHFELEGCYSFAKQDANKKLNFSAVNRTLQSLNIDGELVPEYWKNQWEYVSQFNGQSPLKEADNLAYVIANLPEIFSRQGVEHTLIKPVIWSGDQGKLGIDCHNIFITDNRAVHIPNAVQINVSVLNSKNENIVAETSFGDNLQQAFLQTSLACSLLYLPEEEAFERLALKTRYGLAQELCSPVDISGGHQGSIALYKEVGKHNQAMGVKTLLVDLHNNALISESNWQETARIEHRLGASSLHYCPYINVVFALLNVIDAINTFQNPPALLVDYPNTNLPKSLKPTDQDIGAIAMFEVSDWFNNSINVIQSIFLGEIKKALTIEKIKGELPENIGDKLKECILSKYQQMNKIIY